MKIMKTQLKRIIKEELRVVLENKVASVEKTDMSGAEAGMDPKYRVHSRRAPGLPGTDDPAGEIYIVKLNDGTKITATVSEFEPSSTGLRWGTRSGLDEILLFDLDDRPIDDEALEQEVLAMIQSPKAEEDTVESDILDAIQMLENEEDPNGTLFHVINRLHAALEKL
jgi:hypothetical protein